MSVEYHEWFERDRACVELRDSQSGQTLIIFWDEAVHEAIRDGFLDARDLENSLRSHAAELGFIPIEEVRP